MPLVSIIIPIYNASEYLEYCLNSVIKQSYVNIEIILINDGSTDNSLEICEKFVEDDSRVKVFSQTNQGQAAARNYALHVANGEYVIYVDSDDIVAINYIEELVGLAKKYNADIVQCEYVKFRNCIDDNLINGNEKEVKEYLPQQALEEFCYQRIFNASPWGKLIQRNLANNIEFPVGMGYEDFAIMYQLIGSAKKIIHTNEILYFYRQHAASTMHASFSERKIDRIRIAYDLKDYIDSFYPENNIAVNSRFLLANLQLLMDLPFKKKYSFIRKEIWSNIKSSRKIVIQDRKAKKSLQIMALVSCLGIWSLMVLGRIYRILY